MYSEVCEGLRLQALDNTRNMIAGLNQVLRAGPNPVLGIDAPMLAL